MKSLKKVYVTLMTIFVLSICLLMTSAMSVFAQSYESTVKPTTLWSASGNYNADWAGLDGYDNSSAFTINSAEDMSAFTIAIGQRKKTFEGKTVTLTRDIDLSKYLWDNFAGTKKASAFCGSFDGGGFAISGMIIDYDNNYIGGGSDFCTFGLFALLKDATVKNLTMTGSVLTIGNTSPSLPTGVGVLAGSATGSTIENVQILNSNISTKEAKANAYSLYVGGIIGQEYSIHGTENKANHYVNCVIDHLEIDYANYIESSLFTGFGGLVGGGFPYGAESNYQSEISGCTINQLSIAKTFEGKSGMYECYGGVIGFAPFPVIIENTNVVDLKIDLAMPTVNCEGGEFGAVIGGIVGYGEKDIQKFSDQSKFSVDNCSVTGQISVENSQGLLPVFVGAIDGYGKDASVEKCYTTLDFTDLKGKEGVIYGNIFGKLKTTQEVTTTIENNIFNNFDFIATEAEIDLPSAGYLGSKLSMFKLAGVAENDAEIELSKNWTILKNILDLKNPEALPISFVQCEEKTSELEFFDILNLKIIKQENINDGLVNIFFKILSNEGDVLEWDYTAEIILVKEDPTYTVQYLPGNYGDFEPEIYTGLKAGDTTPLLSDTPKGKEGWVFDGWDANIPDTVTGNITFTAKWVAAEPPHICPVPENVNNTALHAIYLTIIALLVISIILLIIINVRHKLSRHK